MAKMSIGSKHSRKTSRERTRFRLGKWVGIEVGRLWGRDLSGLEGGEQIGTLL